MAVKSSDSITVTFVLQRFDTGAAANADSLPTGTLYIDGTANAETVTITNLSTGVYKAAVTLPSLSIGNRCELVISATVNSVAGKGIVWRDACDVATDSSGQVTVGNYASGKAPLQPTVAGRTLDVTATGCAGIDWSNVENPTTTLVLSGTTIGTCTANADMRGTDNALLATSYTAPLSASGTAGAVWNALLTSYTVAGSFGQRVMTTDSASAGNGAKVTPNGHVAAVLHDAEPDSIPEDAFVSGAFSARVIDTDAITAAKIAPDAGTEIGVAVWASSTRELTSGANIVLDKGTGITGLNDITATAAADAILIRGAANVEASAEAYSLADMLLGVFESKVESGTWTIYRSDGTTIHRTKTITTDAGAEPITRVQ